MVDRMRKPVHRAGATMTHSDQGAARAVPEMVMACDTRTDAVFVGGAIRGIHSGCATGSALHGPMT